MVFLYIEATDSAFTSRDDGARYADAATAHLAASEIAMTDILAGKPSSVFDVRVKGADGATVDRIAVAIAVSSLEPDQA